MTNPDDTSDAPKPRRTTGRIISSGSAGRVPQTITSHVDDIPFVPAFDLLEAAGIGTLKDHEVALIAATLWTETSPSATQGASRWLTAARLLGVSQRL